MKFAKKRDVIVIAAILAAGAVLWLIFGDVLSKQGNIAEVYYRAVLVKTVDLSAGESETFALEQLPNVVISVYSDGSIAFIQSDCPDQICVQAGHLHLAGQFAACLPNQIYIKIISKGVGGTGAPDIVIG